MKGSEFVQRNDLRLLHVVVHEGRVRVWERCKLRGRLGKWGRGVGKRTHLEAVSTARF